MAGASYKRGPLLIKRKGIDVKKHGAHLKARRTSNLKVMIVAIVLVVAIVVGAIAIFSSVRGSARNDAPVETAVDKHETDRAANSTEDETDSKRAEAAVGGEASGESSVSGSNGSNAKSSDGSASSQKVDRGGGKDDGSADNVVDANGSSDADSNNSQGGNDNSSGDSGNSSSNEGTWTGYY